jgi:putative transposase/transposase-like zinc-binding protein
MSAIERCRTAALGGHLDECDACGYQRISYNSCRNRHCPKCQASARLRWVEAQKQALLPVEYFHVVFTLPDALNALLRWNQRMMLNLLFKAVSQTLLEFADRHLGGAPGITAVLHTWGQSMSEHPHLHCIVTGGALSKDESRWTSCRRGYLFPVRALSQVFRGKYCNFLRRAFEHGRLRGAEALPMLASGESFLRYLHELKQQAWVVYAKRPFAGPEQVIEYIGRSTHRVAISNQRIVALESNTVSFRWKDYRDGGRVKVMTLSAQEFIRRFLLHVLPPEFVRLRHYGVLANGRRKSKLARCRELLASGAEVYGQEKAKTEAATPEVQPTENEGTVCERCGVGRMQRRGDLPPACGPPHTTARVMSVHSP